ncbi:MULTISPECIES: LysR family transcriptional regulator [unclassified Luteococcus]|uniref:LysR family transcriptional regulator n=1 Tax=unclassified Luteococcus TaxID=2639923 RepID=UPI00313E65F0
MTDWPELGTLELLVTTARTGSLTAAARELGIAQPNASRSIARLERRLGATLLVRTHRGSTLSAVGRQVAELAEPLLQQAHHFTDGVAELTSRHGSQMEFAASQTIAEYLAPAWLARLHQVDPAAGWHMRVTNSSTVTSLVLTRQVPVGFIETPDLPSGITSRTVHTDRLRVVVDPHHPWARRRRPLTLDELACTSLVVRELGSGTRETLEAALASLDVATPTLVLSSNTAVLGACAAGAGPAVLSELAVRAALQIRRVVEVELAEPDLLTRQLRAIWLGRTPEPLARDLIRVAGSPARISPPES